MRNHESRGIGPGIVLVPFVPILAVFAYSAGCSSNSSSPSSDAGTSSTATSTSSSSTGSTSSSTSSSTSATTTSSSTSSTSSSREAGDAGSGSGSAPPLSFQTDIYVPIIEQHCISCHGPKPDDAGPGSGEQFGKLDMSSVDAGYANLVNHHAAGSACGPFEDGGLVRVIPGNAADSLMYLKVNGWLVDGGQPCGSPMPKSGEIPDGGQAVVVGQIKTWINEGANP